MTAFPPNKLHPPAGPRQEIARERLERELAGAQGLPLVVLSAPMGFGKTTAMRQWHERLSAQGVCTAWLTLDAGDNDVARLIAGLAAAMPAVAGNDVMTALPRQSGAFVLFLDDFEALHEAASIALVRTLIEQLPPTGQVVIGSRTTPALGLPRLRAAGRLLELGIDHLRLSLEEATDYFERRGQTWLSPEARYRLHGKSEGWITALWLASIAMDRAEYRTDALVERFSGSSRAIADYLAEELLAHQPPEVRQFLLRTSILRELDASICQAMVPGVNAADTLRKLDAHNLFLVPLTLSDTYRYHRLFRDFLRARLHSEAPLDTQRLHLIAAGWYESAGRPVPAIDHAIEGEDYPHALSLLLTHAQRLLDEGRMRLLTRWFSAIPPDRLAEHPMLQAVAAWAVLFTHGPDQASAALAQTPLATSQQVDVLAHVNALQPLLLVMQDQYDAAGQAGLASLARLPTGNAFADSLLCNAMANVFVVRGDQAQAQELMHAARQGGSPFGRLYAESIEGLLALEGGRLREAAAHFRMALFATREASLHDTRGNAWASILYARVLYETNALDDAQHLVDTYLPLVCDIGLPGHVIAGYTMRARIAFCAGSIDKAFEALASLEYLGHQRHLPRLVANARLERSRLMLLQGNGPGALTELERADDPAAWAGVTNQRLPANEIDFPALARLRWQLHFGEAAQALPDIEAALAEATAQRRFRRSLRLRVLHALALQRAGDAARAAQALDDVVRTGCAEGFVRLIVDEGPALGRLLQRLQAHVASAPEGYDPAFSTYVQHLLQAVGPLSQQDNAPPPEDALVEPLTRKELQVLELTAEGYSNSALSETLALSDSTIRTHLRNVSTKLRARSRTEAVAIARRLGVIR